MWRLDGPQNQFTCGGLMGPRTSLHVEAWWAPEPVYMWRLDGPQNQFTCGGLMGSRTNLHVEAWWTPEPVYICSENLFPLSGFQLQSIQPVKFNAKWEGKLITRSINWRFQDNHVGWEFRSYIMRCLPTEGMGNVHDCQGRSVWPIMWLFIVSVIIRDTVY